MEARAFVTMTMIALAGLQILQEVPRICLAEMYRIPLRKTNVLINKEVKTHGAKESMESTLKGKPGFGYSIDIIIGTPPQNMSVLVDTGSSNFAVAARPHPYIDHYFHTSNSSTFKNLNRNLEVPYTQGRWQAFLGSDIVSLGNGNLTVNAEIAFITESENFFINNTHWQGILGLGYPEIAQPDSSVIPYFDSLLQQHNINNSFSMQLCGTIDTRHSVDVSIGGTMVIGGVDSTLYSGKVHYVPIRKEWFYEVVITDIAVAGKSLDQDCKEYNFDKTIVDSGTTNLRLPKRVFYKFIEQLKINTPKLQPQPEAFWHREDILCWPKGKIPWDFFPTVSIWLLQEQNASIRLDISPQQYLRAVPDELHPELQNDCFKFAVDASESGAVIGAVIMEGFYVIFDREHRRIGFAKTTCPLRDDNKGSKVTGPYHSKLDLNDCAYRRPKKRPSALTMAAYIMAGISGLCLIPLLIMISKWSWQHICRKHQLRRENADINNLLPDDSIER